MVKFIHTSDLHLGMQAHFLPDEARARFAQDRFDAVRRIAAVGEQPLGPLARAADLPRDGADPVDQGQELGDVVAVATGQRDRQRHPGGVGDQVVL